MPKWENGCIYMLRHADDVELENIYIGSTANFRMRKCQHKNSCNSVNDRNHNESKYQYIRDNGGWDNWKMVWIEDYPCKSKRELLLREDEVMLQYQNRLNKRKAHMTYEEKKEKQKKYHQDNRDKILEQQKEYKQANREIILQKNKEYYKDNHEKLLQKNKEYKQANCEIILQKNKEYRQNNREKIAEKIKEKIKCDICGNEITKYNLPRHQKSLKCQSHKKSTYT
jgi:hypothetical protein